MSIESTVNTLEALGALVEIEEYGVLLVNLPEDRDSVVEILMLLMEARPDESWMVTLDTVRVGWN